VGTEGPIHSRSVRPRTPQPAPLEHDPHPPATEAAQYQVTPAQYQANTYDPHTDATDTHQNDIVEAPHNKPDFAPADTPHNAVETPSVHHLGWTRL